MTLSIVTINRDNVAGLQKTAESVFSQTFTDYEYIVIDGDSSDGGCEYLQSISSKLTYWHSKPDKGIYDALNQGIARAQGDYLLFLHSGDYLLEDTVLERLLATPFTTDVVYADAQRTSEFTGKPEPYSQPEHLTNYFFYRYSLCHQSMFFRRELFAEFGHYRTDLKIVSDWAFNLQLFRTPTVTWEHRAIPITFFDGTGISSTNHQEMQAERQKILKEEFSAQELATLDRQRLFRESMLGKALMKAQLLSRW